MFGSGWKAWLNIRAYNPFKIRNYKHFNMNKDENGFNGSDKNFENMFREAKNKFESEA